MNNNLLSNFRFGLCRFVLGMVIGIFLIINPEAAVEVVVKILAIVLVIAGIFSFYNVYTNKKQDADPGMRRLLTVTGCVCFVLGILMLLMPIWFAGITMFMIGIILTVLGIMQVIALVQTRNSGVALPWTLYLNPVISLVLGIIVLFQPFALAKTMAIFAGAACIVYAISELWAAMSQYRLYKHLK